MTLEDFQGHLSILLAHYFPDAVVEIRTKRMNVLEAKARLDDETFIAIYFNALTGKKSYALISHGRRLLGYDNYKFWHCHPAEKPEEHLPCQEPSLQSVLAEMRSLLHG